MIYENLPPKMVVTRPKGVYYVTVYIDAEPSDNGYEVEGVHLQMTDTPDYASVINALIRYKYPQDEMEAIINNYLLDAGDEGAMQKWNEMQEWRKKVKAFAKEVFGHEQE